MNKLIYSLCLMTCAAPALAIDWTNGAGNNQWGTGGNWTGGAEPNSVTPADIIKSGANRAILSQTGEVADAVRVGVGANAGELQITGGSLTVNTNLEVGGNGGGIVTQTGGVVTLGATAPDINTYGLRVGVGTGNSSYTITGGELRTGNFDEGLLQVGGSAATSGTHSLTVGGTGKLYTNETWIGRDDGATSASVTIQNSGELWASYATSLTWFRISSGSIVVKDNGQFNVGLDPLGGIRSNIAIGRNPNAASVEEAVLHVRDNGIVRAYSIMLGDANGAKAKVIIDGGRVEAPEHFIMGYPGKSDTTTELVMTGGLLQAGLIASSAGFSMGDDFFENKVATFTMTGGRLDARFINIGGSNDTGSSLWTIDAPGTVATTMTNLGVFSNGKVIHKQGDIILGEILEIPTSMDQGGAGRGEYDMWGGTVSMTGDQVALVTSYFTDIDPDTGRPALYSTNPAFESFSVTYNAGTNKTLLMPILGAVENADFDGDGDVDGRDFLIWQRGFGNPGTPATGDANADGAVNSADLAIWKTQYGTAPLKALVAVPEPGSLVLAIALVGQCSLIRRQRGK